MIKTFNYLLILSISIMVAFVQSKRLQQVSKLVLGGIYGALNAKLDTCRARLCSPRAFLGYFACFWRLPTATKLYL